MKIKKATIVRTILLIVAIINRFLTSKGIGFNLFMDDYLAGLVADLFIAITSIVAFWYNNSFTKAALEADSYLEDLRNGYPIEDEDISE